MADVSIRPVRTEDDATKVREMAWEFVGFLDDRYPELAELTAQYLKNQKFEEQLAALLNIFTPPEGECLLAELDGDAVGIVMLKPHDAEIAEMNRMFVRRAGRGAGVGRALANSLIECAREMGYREMVLSALHRHDEALSLYRSLGFKDDKMRQPDVASAGPVEVRLRLSL